MHLEPKKPTAKGPAEWFTSDVYIDAIAGPRTDGQRANVGRVRVTPGACTAWHSHDLGQTMHITRASL